MTMKMELRRVQHASRLSEETNAFSAEVWVDDVHVCDASNHGHGGPDMHYPAKGKTQADVNALNERCKREFGQLIVEGFSLDIDLEIKCGQLLEDWIATRALQRILKRTIAFVRPGERGIRNYKGKIEGVKRAHVITETLRKYPDATILNNIPFDKALELYRAQG